VLSEELTNQARLRGLRRTLTLSGEEFVYYDYPARLANPETIVMIHGYRGNHRGLEAIVGGLGDYRVIVPDLPGFGESSELSSVHNLDAYANWLEQFLSELGLISTANLVGHSFGTLVVGRYASTRDCKSIVLINPVSGPALSGPRAFLTRITSAFYHLSNLLPESIGGWLLRSPIAVMVMSTVMAKTKDRKLRSWIHKQHLSNFSDFATVRVATEGYDASISSDLSVMAPSITTPVLIVAAELDDITAIEIQREVVKLYPRAKLAEISNVGHLVHYEAPEQAANYIRAFIEELK
jgi:pimeloyl-ACP methyl ester carboxylesterase